MEAQAAGNTTSVPKHMLSQTLHVLGETLFAYLMQVLNLLEQQPKLN